MFGKKDVTGLDAIKFGVGLVGYAICKPLSILSHLVYQASDKGAKVFSKMLHQVDKKASEVRSEKESKGAEVKQTACGRARNLVPDVSGASKTSAPDTSEEKKDDKDKG